MVKVLEKAGCTVVYNSEQTCCGQPAFNAGFREESREVCIKFLEDFSGTDYVVSPSASCTGFVRNYYPTLFADSAYLKEVKQTGKRIYEFSDGGIKGWKKEDCQAVLWGKATYHDSCAALSSCKIPAEPRKLLSKVKGLDLVAMADVETCCGFEGTFAVKFESISMAMADQKVRHALDTGADYLISTDMSCLMHLDGHIRHNKLPIQTMHLADVLASGW